MSWPRRVWFLDGFGLKMGIDFPHIGMKLGGIKFWENYSLMTAKKENILHILRGKAITFQMHTANLLEEWLLETAVSSL